MRNFIRSIENTEEALDRIANGWTTALETARNDDPGNTAGPANDGGRSADRTSTTERAAIMALSSQAGELESCLQHIEEAALALASRIVSLSRPRAERLADGRVVFGCANPCGCPVSGMASRQDLCGACWHFFDSNGRHRVTADVVEAAERAREGARLRKQTSRLRLAA